MGADTMPSIKKPPPVEDAAATQAALERQDREKKMAEERYLFEQRVLTLCTGLVILVAVLWTVALSTDHWYELTPPQHGLYLRDTRRVLQGGNSGLWRLCSLEFDPSNVTFYESITTTAAPVSTTKRPRAQPCKIMGLKGRKRKRCRQLITNKFKFGLASRRRASLARKEAAARAANAVPGAVPGAVPSAGPDTDPGAGSDADPDGDADAGPDAGPDDDDAADDVEDTVAAVTAPTPVLSNGTDADGNSTNTDNWNILDFDEAVKAAAETAAEMDPVDAEVAAEPLDPEQEKYLAMAEESIKERIADGKPDNLTISETIEEIADDGVTDIDVKFWDCRARELSEEDKDGAVEWQMLSYMRTLLTFSVVSLLLLLLGFLSALYTFKEPRYTFKRLSAGIQFIACTGLLVVIEVYRRAAAYEQSTQLGGVDMAVGYSQVLAWLALAIQFLCSFFFLLYSRKKKRNKAPNEEIAMADEPAIIGR